MFFSQLDLFVKLLFALLLGGFVFSLCVHACCFSSLVTYVPITAPSISAIANSGSGAILICSRGGLANL